MTVIKNDFNKLNIFRFSSRKEKRKKRENKIYNFAMSINLLFILLFFIHTVIYFNNFYIFKSIIPILYIITIIIASMFLLFFYLFLISINILSKKN